MIKTLIVDDENLVRKGLISVFPWEKYDFQVVGEAGNGEKALEIIKKGEVDLLITDLFMPVLSGLELMREVKLNFPHIWIVVITCHQDFEYVQEALRIGAIDYIVKTQLEKEEIETVLERISAKINRNMRNKVLVSTQSREKEIDIEIDQKVKLKYSEEIISSIINSIKFVKENLSDEINQDIVAKEANMSRGYFSHCFKNIIGISFREYIRKYKMDKAQELLLKNNMPVYSIAAQLGFLDEKYFSKIFKEYVGLLPTEFRNKNRLMSE